jgi:homoserine dehydrogenase
VVKGEIMATTSIAVLKFGSSGLRSERDLPTAVGEIERARDRGDQVLAVVSAFGNTTNRLLRRAQRCSESPHPEALAALLATGEAVAAALLGIALERAGLSAVVLDPARIDLRATGERLDAHPVHVDARRIEEALEGRTAVVPGFVGIDAGGAPALLGRGGSDYTALFLAARLGARRCVLLKDVDGLYTADPAVTGAAERFEDVSWETAREVGGRVVQSKAVRYAESERLSFEVTAPGARSATRVGHGPDRLARRVAEVCA